MAARYWVGGTGNENDTTHWSATDGGASGASVPGTSDDVFFTANSGGGTCTLNVAPTWQSLDMTGSTTTISHSTVTWTITGTLFKLVAGKYTATADSGVIAFTSTTGCSITLAGNTVPAITINGTGTFTHNDLITSRSPNTTTNYTVTAGSVAFGNFNHVFNRFTITANANTRTIAFGSGTITLAGTGTVFTANLATNVTVTGSGTLSITDASASTKATNFAGIVMGTMSLTVAGAVGASTTSLNSGSTSPTPTFQTVTINQDASVTLNSINGFSCQTLIINGASGHTCSFVSSSAGTAAPLRIATSATAHYTTVTDIDASSAVSFNCRDNCTNGGNNHNVDFTATKKSLASAGLELCL